MKTILVIDDDEAILANFRLALEHTGYRVLSISSGEEGLKLARLHRPDLILCDINMPGMDGKKVLHSLRNDTEVGATQIVLMTGNTWAITSREVMALGADDFLTKPVNLADLSRCVAARLRRAQIHRRVDDQTVTALRASLQSSLPHELFTPLAGILGLTAVLRLDLPNLKPPEIAELLEDIERSGWRLQRTLKNYLAVLDLELGPVAGKTVPEVLVGDHTQAAVTGGATAAARRYKREKDLTLQVATATITGRAEAVPVIVEELVDNACSFSRPGTPILVQLDERGVLRVTDRGRA